MYTHMSEQYASVSAGIKGQLKTLKVLNQHCSAEIALFGAHLLSFIPHRDNKERLWLSPNAVFDKSKPIRGGVPICWPWFADIFPGAPATDDAKLPAHGFVRTQDWRIIAIKESAEASIITLGPKQLGLYGSHPKLSVLLEVTFAEKCTIKLISDNASEESVTITAALHTYFMLTDIQQTTILGVEGQYVDKTRKDGTFEQTLPYRIEQETDRIHLRDSNNHFDFIDIASPNTNIRIQQQGHDSVVIWNPWQQKSKIMADMTKDGYLNMLCVEASNTQGMTIAAHAQHALVQIIS